MKADYPSTVPPSTLIPGTDNQEPRFFANTNIHLQSEAVIDYEHLKIINGSV